MTDEKQPGVCGQPCEVYSRVCGYLRPVQQWNPGRKSEYAKRLMFRMAPQEAEYTEYDHEINAAINQRFEGSVGY
jgi:hypothetical protein